MADDKVHNVVILQPREVRETCCESQPVKTQCVDSTEESCLNAYAGRATQQSYGTVRSLAFSVCRDEDIGWKRIEPSDFKPFHGSLMIVFIYVSDLVDIICIRPIYRGSIWI